MVYESALNVYTDGSSFSHPRRGGLALRFVWIDELGNEVTEGEELRGYQTATNDEIGKACGNTCISRNNICHVGPGCAYMSAPATRTPPSARVIRYSRSRPNPSQSKGCISWKK